MIRGGIVLRIDDVISREELMDFVRCSSNDFKPPLHSIVDLEEYCEKLLAKASFLVTREKDKVVGVIAFYCNDKIQSQAYVSYFYVKPNKRGKGLGQTLLREAILHAKACGMKSMKLETHVGSRAVALYQRNGFTQENVKDIARTNRIVMAAHFEDLPELSEQMSVGPVRKDRHGAGGRNYFEKTVVPTGYAHHAYAESLAEFGEPQELPRCGGWILKRQIPGFSLQDGMGCYPLFCCRDWSQLHYDLDDLGSDMVSLALVTDPFGDYDLAYLRRCFDFVKPFKEHFVADLSLPREQIISKHHRKCVRRSKQRVTVERCDSPADFVDEWTRLYDFLKIKHNIDGIRAFSGRSFGKQLAVPGVELFRVLHEGVTIGANLIYLEGDVAYGHLSAFDSQGYNLYAPYAVKWAAFDFLSDKVRWFDLGAATGTDTDGQDGLSKFKRGWSTGTRTAYLCGRIFDKDKYWEIVKSKRIGNTDYFPAYRAGEFK